MTAVYFLGHALLGKSGSSSETYDSLAMGMGSTILAIALTLSGFSYPNEVAKIVVVAFLYCAAAYLFWHAYKTYLSSKVRDRN